MTEIDPALMKVVSSACQCGRYVLLPYMAGVRLRIWYSQLQPICSTFLALSIQVRIPVQVENFV